ncbi:Trypsin epsilon [Lucilia cuprina]|uniref:Trypsin epsilon n=1 Tax=Lucilia cuprina TaxID=7375 RepID=A0A0L0CLG5_LUCCU|nr:trypsin alpha-3-like [Lucilia cuprina]KNC33091.1 Trypsin epsilon [Lucilia cuprina]
MLVTFLLVTTLLLQFHGTIVETRSARIVGGRPVYIEQFPYMVNLRREGSFYCGGSLITPKCVLTAAHCIRRPREITVQAGATYLHEDYYQRRVKKIFRPKSFDEKTLDNDVAIFKLNSPFRERFIESIELSNDMPQKGDFVKVSGWGLTRENGTVSQQLRSVYVEVLSHEECREIYLNYRNVTKSMFCASIPGVKDACAADSGGPVLLDDQLVGIVSWGRGRECAREESPGVYVNINALRPWIDKIVDEYC